MLSNVGTILLATAWCASGAAATSLTVPTTSGHVQGKWASGTNGVAEFLGIPYAQPPVGDLRWATPEAYNSSSVIDATKFGYSCPANSTFTSNAEFDIVAKEYNFTTQATTILENLLEVPYVTYSEDCLTLNVWTKPATNGTKKPVLFWIYGGGFNTGTSNNTAYNGKHIADLEDVVVVSANYRMNIFGFPGNPNIRNNLGLLDQRLAIEWARDNIAKFGGDPDRIVIFGQSAGGSSVDYYSFAWTSDPIVSGFIAESGNVFPSGSQADESTAAASWYNVTGTLGCGDADSDPATVLSCMRSKDWESVQGAIPVSSGTSSVTGSFGPTIDDIVVFSDYPTRLAAGNFIKRPLFIGSNNNEIGIFRPIFDAENVTLSDTEWTALLFLLYTCPANFRAAASVSNGVPTWRYRYFGEFPNLRLTVTPDSGAWHGSELPLIFNTDMEIQNIVPRTAAETQMANYLRGAWVAFANDTKNGLTNYGLPQYNTLEPTLIQLGYNNTIGPQAVLPSTYDTGCVLDTTLAELLLALEKL